jgi:hypothetical protein
MIPARALALAVLLAWPAAGFVTLSPTDTIEEADRWSAAPHPATGFTGLHDRIQVAIEPGMAEELVLAVTGSATPEDVTLAEQAVVAAFRAWESPVLRFDITLDGPAVEGPTIGEEVDVPRRARHPSGVLAGSALRGADIYLNLGSRWERRASDTRRGRSSQMGSGG